MTYVFYVVKFILDHNCLYRSHIAAWFSSDRCHLGIFSSGRGWNILIIVMYR